jgi:hypothetical protein
MKNNVYLNEIMYLNYTAVLYHFKTADVNLAGIENLGGTLSRRDYSLVANAFPPQAIMP